MSPTAAMNVVAVIRLTPGTVIRRLIACRAERVLGDRRVRGSAISASRKSIWRRHPSTVSRSSAGSSSSASHTRPPRPKTSLIGGRPLSVAHQHRVDLVLGARALAHQLRAARQTPAQRPRRLIRQPAAVQQPGGQQPRERARVAAVGLDLGLGDRPQLVPGRHDHPRHVRLQRPRDRQRVAGRLQRHVIVRRRGCRPGSAAPPGWSARDRRSARALPRRSRSRRNRRWTSNPMNRTHVSLHSHRHDGRPGGQTTRTDSCSRHSRASRRGGHRGDVGLAAHLKLGLPSLRSPREPLSRCARR